ncbi:MAG: hypothetical protein GXP49_08015 [Deltaproteobacteria bacterium]|nr:hypothetical protein [Deltaproteobacteria bacterium]
MLDYMREHSKSVLIYILFAIIIMAFILTFGPGSITKCDLTPKYVAKVNGRVLTLDEYRIELQQLQSYYESRFGDAFTPKLAERLGLRRSALENLIQDRLMVEEAKRLGIFVSDDEVLNEVSNLSWAKEKGKFNFDRFEKMVRYHFKTSLAKFKERLRSQIAISRFKALLKGSVMVSDAEIEDRFDLENEKVDLEYLQFDPGNYKDSISITAQDVSNYLEKHDKEARNYYDEHERMYNKPKAVRARRILIKVDADTSDRVKKRLKRRAKKLRRRVIKGIDFAKIAKKYSDGPKKEQGGDMGFIEPGMVEPAMEKELFKLGKGEISEVFETSTGYNIVKVEDIRPAVVKKYEDVKDEIARRLIMQEQSVEMAKKDAENALNKVKSGMSFTDFMAAFDNAEDKNNKDIPIAVKPKKSMTGPFTRDREDIPWIGKSAELLKEAFDMEKGKVVPKVYHINGKFFIVRVRDHIMPNMQDLEKQRGLLRYRIRDEKARELLADWMKHAREEASVEVASNLGMMNKQ